MKNRSLNIEKIKANLLKKEKNALLLKQKEQEEIIASLKKLKHVWEKYGTEKVYLYGSFADLSFNKYSDIDIAIQSDIKFEAFLKLYSEVNKHFKRQVDVRVLSELPFIDEVKSKGILIYERKNSNFKKCDTTGFKKT